MAPHTFRDAPQFIGGEFWSTIILSSIHTAARLLPVEVVQSIAKVQRAGPKECASSIFRCVRRAHFPTAIFPEKTRARALCPLR